MVQLIWFLLLFVCFKSAHRKIFWFLLFFRHSHAQNALLSALPYLAMWLMSLAVCPISDYLINRDYITVSTGRKLFNSFGHWVPAITLIALPFMRGSTEAVTLLTIGIGFNGFTYCGYILNHMDLSPNFAGTLMGLTNTLANIMSILGPLTVGYILTETTDTEVSIKCPHFEKTKVQWLLFHALIWTFDHFTLLSGLPMMAMFCSLVVFQFYATKYS